MNKPRIFIGSSSEGLEVANTVKEVLSKDFDCVLWNDGTVFGLSTSYLDSLLKAGSMFDFGILVATKDDRIHSRGEDQYAARDNVLFEYGLFMGRLGKFRTLILLEDEAKRPSDMEGIYLSEFNKTAKEGDYKSLTHQLQVIAAHIQEKYKLSELGLLPSTAIAMGFYENFVKRICDYLRTKDFVEIDHVRYEEFEIQIVIPSVLQHNMQDSADHYFKINKLTRHEFKPETGRGIRTRIAQDSNNPNKLIICDIPTTLTAVYDSIALYLKDGQTESKEFKLIEAREIHNFLTVLKTKLIRDPFSKSILKFIEYTF
jgi:hypothetical protein